MTITFIYNLRSNIFLFFTYIDLSPFRTTFLLILFNFQMEPFLKVITYCPAFLSMIYWLLSFLDDSSSSLKPSFVAYMQTMSYSCGINRLKIRILKFQSPEPTLTGHATLRKFETQQPHLSNGDVYTCTAYAKIYSEDQIKMTTCPINFQLSCDLHDRNGISQGIMENK